MNLEPKRGEVWWVRLDPTQGSEIKKTRPCVIVSHDTLNRLRQTVIVVPLSSSAGAHPPITISITCHGKPGVAVVDQIRAIAKHRLTTKIETMSSASLAELSRAIGQILQLVGTKG
jgi:mRNA interferase MazF